MQDFSGTWRRARTVFLAACLAPAAALPMPALAETGEIFKTGEELYPLCVSSDENDLVACDWYLMGVFDAITLYSDVEYSQKLVCVAGSVTAEQIRDIVIAYMENSDSMDYSAVSLVFNAIQEAFPCDEGSAV